MSKVLKIIFAIIFISIAIGLVCINEALIEYQYIIRGSFENSLMAYFIIICIFIGVIFLFLVIDLNTQRMIENIKKYKYIRLLIITTGISFFSLISFGILGSAHIDKTWSKWIIIVLMILTFGSIVVNCILHGIDQTKKNSEIQKQHVFQFDYNRVKKEKFQAINSFYYGSISFKNDGLYFNFFDYLLSYEKINFIIKSDILKTTVYNELIIKLNEEETTKLICQALDFIDKYEYNDEYIRSFLEDNTINAEFELSFFLTYNVYFQLLKNNIKVPDLDKIVEETAKVINTLPIMESANYTYQFAEGLINPRPATMKEGFYYQKNHIFVNCSLEKVVDLLKNIIKQCRQSMKFILETPCTKREENESNDNNKSHRNIYCIDDISIFQLEMVLDIYGDFLLNEGLISWEIVMSDLTRVIITSCKTIVIITRDKEIYKRILEENSLPYNAKLKIIENYALYIETKNYDSNQYTITNLIKDLEQFGIYHKSMFEVRN